MAEKSFCSLRARLELAAYNGLSGLVALGGAAGVPVFRHYFSRIDEGFTDYLGLVVQPQKRPTLWVHGVSMGESLVAIAFAGELKRMFPEYSLVFTSTHPDVIKAMQKKQIADVVAFFPLDTPLTMQRAFKRIDPVAVFVAETDFWPNFSQQCRRRRIPLMLINGRISTKIADFYRRVVGLAEIVFGAFSEFLVQGSADRERLLQLGVEPSKITVAGNIKADLTVISDSVDLDSIKKWQGNRSMVVFGSVHPTEFELLLPVFSDLARQGVAVLIAPRNLKFAEEWQARLKEAGLTVGLRRQYSGNDWQIMLLDTMGELAAVYGLARVAFVGGSIDDKVGGHNPLEVIQQKVPLLMGPNFRNFADIVEQLQQAEAIKICVTAADFQREINQLLSDSDQRMVGAATEVLEKNRGALQFTLDRAKLAIVSR
jgi:3-deoxy-D-manno-octulosonic-acid transferase